MPRLRSVLRAQSRRFRRVLFIPLAFFIALCAKDLLLEYVHSSSRHPSLNSLPVSPIPSPPEIRQKRLGSHRYLQNGLVLVNPNGPHPIFSLMRRAEQEWEAKLRRASKTLEEAVVEYKRRYHRPPPKGFNYWWDYVQKHNVQLPDEYDFIWRDLEPFWGISPSDLRKIQAKQEEFQDSFTLGKNGTHRIDVVKRSFSTPETWQQRALLRGADEIMDLLEGVEHLIPPFRAVFSPHDNPKLLSDYNLKKMALDAAAERRYIDLQNLPPIEDLGYVSACAPSSPARQESPINQAIRPPPSTNRTFIHNHRLAMDPCLHPQLFYYHSEFIPHRRGPPPERTLAPQFSYCSTMLHHDIQPPTFISWVDDIPRTGDPEWENKTDHRLMWRGSNTGMNFEPDELWRFAQRPRLVSWANDLEGTANVLLPPVTDREPVGTGRDIPRALLNPAVNDIAFSGSPIACVQPYCDHLATVFEWRRVQDSFSTEAGNHKYFVDVDGNGWSSRFKRLITSNSLVFKATIYPEWFSDRVAPWVHYVPVQVDLSDLYDALLFFRGGLYGEGAHDAHARRIATAGRMWSKSFWRKEDMTAYMFRQMLEYARLMSLNREAASYNG